jgi:hypothetical protein
MPPNKRPAAADFAPEAHNQSQDDAGEQAQTLADEALGRGSDFGAGDSEKPDYTGFSDNDEDSTPDLVDTMNQMVSSGHIDMGAFRGERNDDDEEDGLGEQGIEDDRPRGAE